MSFSVSKGIKLVGREELLLLCQEHKVVEFVSDFGTT